MNLPWLKAYDPGVPAALQYPEVTVHGLLEKSASQFSDSTFLISSSGQITYQMTYAQVESFAAILNHLGLAKGERVAVCLPNNPAFVVAFFGILKAGGVVTALNPNHKLPELISQISEADCSFLVGSVENQPVLRSAMKLTGLRGLILVGVDPDGLLVVTEDGDQFFPLFIREGRSNLANLPEVSSNEPAIFQFSGGTTGKSKAAIGLHRNLVANAYQFRSWLVGLKDGCETVMAAIPLYHVYGMVLGVCLGAFMGARVVLPPDPRDSRSILDLLEKHKVSFFPAVPTMLRNLLKVPGMEDGEHRLTSLKACISGSAPLPGSVQIPFERITGVQIMEGYGLSEAPTATHCNPMFGVKKPGSIGLPLPDVDCRIVSLENGETIVGRGEAGELLIRGPQVMAGYYNQPEETNLALRNGWLHTGDVARMDSDGYFYVLERKKDLIKVGGLQVWPREIEDVLSSHPAISEVAAAGVPDEMSGERVKAWVVLKQGASVGPPELIRLCAEYLAAYKLPIEIEIVSQLARTPVGKIWRYEMVRQHIQSKKNNPA